MARPVDVYIGSPETEATLVAELSTKRRHPKVVAPGCVLIGSSSSPPDPVFARQLLPGAVRVEARGTDDLAQAVFSQCRCEESALLSGAVGLTVGAPPPARPPRGQRPKAPLAAAARTLADTLEKKRAGRARKRGVDTVDTATQRIEVFLVADHRAYVSAPFDIAPDALTAWPVPFVGGTAPVRNVPAPSSAYRKLVEAMQWLGERPRPGDVAVDLGGAPGGWSFVLLQGGARVVAYDRGDMDAGLLAQTAFEHRRQDAFAHASFDGVDVVVCDIIDGPERIVGLLRKALEAGPRWAVFTVKLKAPIDIDEVRAIKDKLAGDTRYTLRVKHLLHNKTEVTVMMRRRG